MSLTVQGVSVPDFMYGTAWKEEQTASLTRHALQAGFRAVDTANQRKHYHEAGVGVGLAAAFAEDRIDRSTVFLQSKFTHPYGHDHRLPYDPSSDPAAQVAQSLASSLDHLGVPTLDAYLLHGPDGRQGLNTLDWAVWRAMERAHGQGQTRLLGISNVSRFEVEELWHGSTIKPAFVQNQCPAKTYWDRDVRLFCREHGIIYQGFSLLTANRLELEHPSVAAIAANYEATVAQVVFSFATAIGILPLTGTTNPQHMREDLEGCRLPLTSFEVETMERLATGSAPAPR